MSQLKAVHTEKAPQAIGPYSQAISAGGWLYCSGQIALNPETGAMTGEDAASQAKLCLENLTRVLEAGGADWSKVVKATIFLADMGDFAAVNGIYEQYVGDPAPARACVAARTLPKNALVEVDCVAFLG